MVTRRVVKEWEASFQALHGRIGRRFKRAEPRERVYRYLRGILSNIARNVTIRRKVPQNEVHVQIW